MIFRNRSEAGRALSDQLRSYANRDDVIVLALPRGGVPVAFEVAQELGAPLDVFIVRKLGAPGHEEYAIGAIASGDVRILNEEAIRSLRITQEQLDAATAKESLELKRREQQYRGERQLPDLQGRVVILVDDGLATGSTMRAATRAVRQQDPKQIVVAVPVAARSTCDALKDEADEVICLYTPFDFYAVGQCYEDFSQTSDDEVHELID